MFGLALIKLVNMFFRLKNKDTLTLSALITRIMVNRPAYIYEVNTTVMRFPRLTLYLQ
jgi:hypothetical protein